MPPNGPEYASIVDFLHEQLLTQTTGQVLVQSQNSLELDERSELYPDLAVLARRQDRYFSRASRPEEVILLIEVGHTTCIYDYGTKLLIYQKAGIPEIWLIDLQQRLLLSYVRI
jgi:Uma2 family endonuclease